MTRATVDQNWLTAYPPRLLAGLAWLIAEGRLELYASGGVVRDWLRGRSANDLDLTVARQAMVWAQRLAEHLPGRYVPLDEGEDVARVVFDGFVVDFSSFREGSRTIAEDLGKRDFTVNAMAIRLQPQGQTLKLDEALHDPLAGRRDLAGKQLRATSPAIFHSDPLRLLRAYRFMAQADFVFTPQLAILIRNSVHLLPRVSVERINYELELIVAADSAPTVLARMGADGLWPALFPEWPGDSPTSPPPLPPPSCRPPFLATFSWLLKIQHDPEHYFPDAGPALRHYLEDGSRRQWLRWAGLLHGLGQAAAADRPLTAGLGPTVYRRGLLPFSQLAGRLRWSRLARRQVGIFIEHQSWPGYIRALTGSPEQLALAAFRLVKEVGAEWRGLFPLALAAALAAQESPSPEAPAWLLSLYKQVAILVRERIQPLLSTPPLLSGHELQSRFHLEPGPRLGKLLLRLEEERLLQPGLTRAAAVEWVGRILAEE